MTEHRWSKFWWQDYESDDALRVVSLAAQGLWMRMLCTMHKGAPYGHLTINSKQPTNRQIALMASTTEREAGKLLGELEEAGVFSRIEDGTIYNRRMVRDKALSEKAHADGKRGGNPALKPISEGGLTPPDNGGGYSLEAEADTEAEAEKKDPPSLRSGTPQPKGRGSRLPDDWQPKEPDLPSQHGAEPAGTLAHFRDHYRAKPGAAGVMLDWEAAWRNWCRKISDFKRAPPGRLPVKTSQMSVPDQNAELLRLMGRHYESEDETPATQLRIVQ